MLVSPVLFAMETVPLLFYILIGLAVLAIPAAYVWDKVVQPKLEEKRKAAEEARQAAEEGGLEEAGAEEGEIEEGLVTGEEGELPMPAGEGEEGGEALAEPEGEMEFGEPHEEDAADEGPEDMFKIDIGN